MGETVEIQVKIIKIHLVLLLLLCVIALVFFNRPMTWIYGYVFGGLIGVLNFVQLAKTMEKAVTLPMAKAQGYAASRYFIRYTITGVVLIVSLKADYIHALATVIGLVLIKFIILVTHLFDDKEYYKRIFKRKEEN